MTAQHQPDTMESVTTSAVPATSTNARRLRTLNDAVAVQEFDGDYRVAPRHQERAEPETRNTTVPGIRIGARICKEVYTKTETANQYIEITPGVCRGKPLIVGHRVTVANIVVWRECLGKGADELATDTNWR